MSDDNKWFILPTSDEWNKRADYMTDDQYRRWLYLPPDGIEYQSDALLIRYSGSGRIDLILKALKAGAFVDADRNTPIYCAARSGCLEAVKLLLEHGAKVSRLAFIAAKRYNYHEIAKLLEEAREKDL